MDQKIKTLIGEYVFTIFTLQQQLDEANARIEQLTKEKNENIA